MRKKNLWTEKKLLNKMQTKKKTGFYMNFLHKTTEKKTLK